MTLCCLILAHAKPAVTARLVRRMLGAGIACHVHVDAKADLAPFQQALPAEAHLLRERVEVWWAGFSMIEAVCRLAETALAQPAHTHFLHLSGDTYPIKPMPRLIEMMTADADWIDSGEVPPGDPILSRIERCYLPDCAIGNLSQRESYTDRHLDAATVGRLDDFARAFSMKQAGRFPWRYAKGANWWLLRRETLLRCLDVYRHRPEIVDWFRYSAHPDESFFNSAVLNLLGQPSPFGCPILALWDRQPRPYEFRTAEDLPLLRTAWQPLARKFAADSLPLLEAIDAELGAAPG
ncbi:hypothetical protein JMJ56_19100 [Belnapia sp. T18]|uniref:Core-2/I-Branching enzyme n=1 Tax=Belnapia arida TaxID=2804533 RepID=A0ABS1U652_9PROT|nr:beta-1,6-N-acetylglucosaminyltransferase [Belnapia arida]MBL6080128.1 hypothetical protein [Belnapia arida]